MSQRGQDGTVCLFLLKYCFRSYVHLIHLSIDWLYRCKCIKQEEKGSHHEGRENPSQLRAHENKQKCNAKQEQQARLWVWCIVYHFLHIYEQLTCKIKAWNPGHTLFMNICHEGVFFIEVVVSTTVICLCEYCHLVKKWGTQVASNK